MEVGPRRHAGPTHTKGAIVIRSLKRLRRPQLPNVAADSLGSSACVGFLVLPLSDQLY
jgi:hypothetical protein